MSRIADALDRLEAAATKGGVVLRHARSYGAEQEPFDEEKWAPEFKKYGITLPEEYLFLLRRWNGLSLSID